VARAWLNVGCPLDGPRPETIGVKAHHVFQVIQVVDEGHVLAISGNDHNAVRTRIRPTSDVIGWREVTDERPTPDKPASTPDKTAAEKGDSDKGSDDITPKSHRRPAHAAGAPATPPPIVSKSDSC
jgi:hypothetical protein